MSLLRAGAERQRKKIETFWQIVIWKGASCELAENKAAWGAGIVSGNLMLVSKYATYLKECLFPSQTLLYICK